VPTKTIKIEPSKEHPLPYDMSDQEAPTHVDAMKVAANTADLLDELGGDISLPEVEDEKDEHAMKALMEQALRKGNSKALQTTVGGRAAQQFMKNYAGELSADTARIRSALTNKLMELADHGDPKIELKAIELLGKHSDIGMFTERSEININYNSPEALEKAIKDRVKRLLNTQLIEVKPLADAADELFARQREPIHEGEYEDVAPEPAETGQPEGGDLSAEAEDA